MSWMSYEEACDRGYCGPPPSRRRRTYSCTDRMCGALDCDNCYPGGGYDEDEEDEYGEVVTSKIVTARKARFEGTSQEIRPGDRVQVESGFEYKVDGPRLGYFRRYRRFTKGPAWPKEKQDPAFATDADLPF